MLWGNPRNFWCYKDEDFVGTVKSVCSRTRHPNTLEEVYAYFNRERTSSGSHEQKKRNGPLHARTPFVSECVFVLISFAEVVLKKASLHEAIASSLEPE